jgi:hypothetical protein
VCEKYTGGIYRHIEDGDCAEFAHRPLFLIALERGIDRVCKFSDDGDRPSCAWQRGLLGAVDSLLKDKECEDDSGGGVEDRGVLWEERRRRKVVVGWDCAGDFRRRGGHRRLRRRVVGGWY